MYLRSLRLHQRLHEIETVLLVFGDKMPGSGDYRTVIPFESLVGLLVERRRCQVFDLER